MESQDSAPPGGGAVVLLNLVATWSPPFAPTHPDAPGAPLAKNLERRVPPGPGLYAQNTGNPGPGTVGILGLSRDPGSCKDLERHFWHPGDTANPKLGAVFTLVISDSALRRLQRHFGDLGDTLKTQVQRLRGLGKHS